MDIVKKMRLQIEEGYKEFFKKKLESYGVKSPAELSKDQKTKFFNEIEKEWKGKNESISEGVSDLSAASDMFFNLIKKGKSFDVASKNVQKEFGYSNNEMFSLMKEISKKS